MLRFINIHNSSRTQRRPSSSLSIASSFTSILSPVSKPSKDGTSTREVLHAFDFEGQSAGKAVLERLGRQRPEAFSNLGAEIAFCFSVCMAQILTEYFLSGFIFLLPQLVKEFDIPSTSAVWPASSFSLVIASTLLVFGRLADIYGAYYLFIIGLAWLSTWAIVSGFSRDQLMLNLCRALQGLGPAAFLPSSVMLIGSIYRPGPRKNLVFSIYGACSVVGFFVGMLFAGAAAQCSVLGIYSWVGAGLTSITACVAIFSIPPDHSKQRSLGITMDWLGSLLIVLGLLLVVFAIIDGAHAPHGWATLYIPLMFLCGIILLGGAVYVEGWVSEHPLLPADLFKVKCMKPLCVALFFNYGLTAIFLLYAVYYFQDVMGASSLQMVAWFVPLGIGGVTLATTGGFLMHLIPGTLLLIISGAGWIGASLLLALMPAGANYWAFIFPSMILATIGIDITFNVANVFITTSTPSARQGLAGALTNSILHLSMAVLLGIADIIQTRTAHLGPRRSYQNVFWFMLGISSTALFFMLFFVKIKRAKSDLTADERQTLRRLETSRTRSEDMIFQQFRLNAYELEEQERAKTSTAGAGELDFNITASIPGGMKRSREDSVTDEVLRKPLPTAHVL